jgi:5-amino-6-(5-phosphoribosylamino)uracil reductase
MRVISNTAISLDGRIATGDERPPMLGSRRDRQRMRQIRAQVDAVLVGGATFRRWPLPTLPADDALENRDKPFWNIIVTRHADIRPGPAYLAETRARKLILTTREHRKIDFETELEVYPGSDIDIHWLISCLERRGIERVLVEAGGDLIAQLLAAGVLDELYVTLCPLLIGGKTGPSLVDGPGFLADKLPRLQLNKLEQLEDELYLHYLVQK